MGRRSKLTEKQWAEFAKRHLNGESLRSLAKEFGVSESAAREQISAHTEKIKSVANQIVNTNKALKELPIAAQISAHGYAAKLMAIQDALSDAAISGAHVAKRVSELAHKRAKGAKDADLDAEGLKGYMAAGMVVNTHARLGMDLLAIAAKQTPEVDPDKPRRIEFVNAPDE